jgi:glucosylceramidase
MTDSVKAEAIEALYGNSGLRLNWGRLHIGSADFSLSEYSYVTEGDKTLATFSLDRDKKYVFPFLKAALKVQPQLTLFGYQCSESP